jgi:hypothetical protein
MTEATDYLKRDYVRILVGNLTVFKKVSVSRIYRYAGISVSRILHCICACRGLKTGRLRSKVMRPYLEDIRRTP